MLQASASKQLRLSDPIFISTCFSSSAALCAQKRFRTHRVADQAQSTKEFELKILQGSTASLWLKLSHFTVGGFKITSFLLGLHGYVFRLLFNPLAAGT